VSQYQSILSSKALERLAAVMDSRVAVLLGEAFHAQVDGGIETRLAESHRSSDNRPASESHDTRGCR
jgi:hypothetical protein